MTDKKESLTYDATWGSPSPRTLTADNNLDLVLGSVTHLPLKYWRKNFFFKGGVNSELKTMTQGQFPTKFNPRATHPVFALQQVAGGVGFKVCPCSSSSWRHQKWIKKGTRLLHTGRIMEKTTFIIDNIQFNLPASKAMQLRFMGQVAESDVHSSHGGD